MVETLQGRVLDELQELVEDPDETEDVLRLGLYRFPRKRFPRRRALAPELTDYDGPRLLDDGIDLIIGAVQSHTQLHTRGTPTATDA